MPRNLRIADWTERLSHTSLTTALSSTSTHQVLLYDYRNVTFLFLSLFSTALALSPTSTVIPGALALATLRTYSHFVFPSVNVTRNSILFVLSIAAGSAIPNLSASQSALDTRVLSFVLLPCLSCLTSVLVAGALFVDWQVSRKFGGSVTSLFFFPALWATLWRTIAYISPVGNNLTWTRPTTIEGYQWLIPIVGPASMDWITAAWAVVLSRGFQTWYMGQSEVEDSDSELDDARPPAKASTSSIPLALFLSSLLLPSLIITKTPLPVADIEHVTPVGVGCILPTFQRYQHHTLTLQDYIDESKKYQNAARLLLWPEGAVQFASDEERDAAFKEVRANITGSYVGVSFEQVSADPNDPSGAKAHKRTGVAVIHHDHEEPLLLYYKRHLVPIAESYHLAHSIDPPTLTDVTIPRPKGVPPTKWDPSPQHQRALGITASICLDFAFPDPFHGLDSRPGVILAPARTWESSVGMSMWLQAKQRAMELDSVVLWCDGGDGGVSGIGGGGIQEFQQIGPGSWVRTIGVQYPFNEKRTFYARLEDVTVLLYWLFAGSASFVSMVRGSARLLERRRSQAAIERDHEAASDRLLIDI